MILTQVGTFDFYGAYHSSKTIPEFSASNSTQKTAMIGTSIALIFVPGLGEEEGVAKGSQVAINRLAGNAFRDYFAGLLRKAGRDVELEVYKWTPMGPRFIDVEVSLEGKVLGGIETKLGGSRYLVLQRLKDAYLTYVKKYAGDRG